MYRDTAFGSLRSANRTRQRSEVRRLLRDRRISLLYAYEGVKRARALDGNSEAQIRSLASQCDIFVAQHEHVHHRYISHNGRVRIVQRFGPIKRMHQLLVADLLAALHPPREDQYLFRGGMPMALRAIEAAYNAGDEYAAEVDFIDFYGSIRLPHLAETLYPLPASVVENVVWDMTCRRSADDDITAPHDGGPASLTGLVGLSLGAASSPIVGERIIGLLLDRAQIGRVVTYADNILVLGRDRADVEARAERLREHAERLETGSVRLRAERAKSFASYVGPPDDPHYECVQFASQRGHAYSGGLQWEPSLEKQGAYRIADGDAFLAPEQIRELESQVIHWRRGYPMWRDGDAFMNDRLAELAALRFYQQATPDNMVGARNALIAAYLGHRGELDLREILPDGATETQRQRRWSLYCETGDLLASLIERAA